MAAAQQLIRGNIHCADDRDQFRARKAELVALLDDPDTANDLIAQSWRAHSLVHVLTDALAPVRAEIDADGSRQPDMSQTGGAGASNALTDDGQAA